MVSYTKRLERIRILLDAEIKLHQEIIKYIQSDLSEVINKLDDDKKANDLLVKNDYNRYNSHLIRTPGYTSNSVLEEVIINGDKSTYDYILDLKTRDLLKSSVLKREEEIKKIMERLNVVMGYINDTRFPGAELWKIEIANVLEKIKEGIRTEWAFENTPDI